MKRSFLFAGFFLFLVWYFQTDLFVFADKISLPFGDNPESLKHLPKIDVDIEEASALGISPVALFLRKLLATVGSFLSLVLGPVATFLIFIAGYELISAQSAASEEMAKQKMNVVYILIGLVVFALSGDLVYNYLYAEEGSFLLDEQKARFIGEATAFRIKQILNLFLSFSGAGAILVLVIAGIQLVLNPGSEEDIEKQKKVVGYVAVGIIIIGLADTLINRIIFPAAGTRGMSVETFEAQLKGLSNYVLGFLGVAIFVSFVISGVLMVANRGDEETWGKVKTTMKNILIGSFVSFSAYTIVATLLTTLLGAEEGTPFE